MKKRTLLFFICLLSSVEVYAETFDAIVHWAKRIELGPLVGGTVAEVNADVGDFVRQGTPLLRIDDKPYATSASIRENQLASTTASRDNAKDELARQQELFDIGSLSTVDLDKAIFNHTQAESNYQQAKGALALAQLELAHTVLTAPFDGWIVEQHTTVGQKVNASQRVPVLFVMVPTGSYVARASIPTEVLLRLEMNGKAVVVISEKRHQASIVMSESVNSGESIISFRFNTSDESYLPGAPAKIEIE
ncbi:MAG: efflux RND transporter periplasmic adaptor subunit [Gammaproteobacteria bacterium]|nr:efflux RND transporter periplasmic adaptor subunit [Gammaproteobacteria bacterium]